MYTTPLVYESGSQGDWLRQAAAAAPLLICGVGRQGTILLAEGQCLDRWGLREELAPGKSLQQLSGSLPEVAAWLRRGLAGQQSPSTLEVRGVILDCWFSPLRNAAGDAIGVLGVGMDVTERHLAQKRFAAERESLADERRAGKDLLRLYELDRQSIAYEIHDGLVQEATGAQMHLEGLLAKLSASPLQDEVALAASLVRSAIDQARQLIRGMRPSILDELGIVGAIEQVIADYPDGGPQIDFVNHLPPGRWEPFLELSVFRIVQEAIANVRRHSKSDRAEVRLTQADDRIHIEIRDWGVGFNPAVVKQKRLGLIGIRQRARLLRGQAAVDSAPGQGTRVVVDVPLSGGSLGTSIMNDRSVE